MRVRWVRQQAVLQAEAALVRRPKRYTLNTGAQAAALCPRILNDKEALWHKWVQVFNKIGQQRAIVPYIPLRNPQLQADTYTSLLLHFLDKDPAELLRLIGEWPNSLYDMAGLIQAAKARLAQAPQDEVLLQVLAQLLVSNGRYEQALEMYLKLKLAEEVFSLINTYDLFTAVKDKVQPVRPMPRAAARPRLGRLMPAGSIIWLDWMPAGNSTCAACVRVPACWAGRRCRATRGACASVSLLHASPQQRLSRGL